MRLIERIFRRFLAVIPYEARRRQDENALPSATFENIRLVLAYYLESKGSPSFVQIGACDGVSGDASHPFIKCGLMQSILVEPIEQSFRKLKKAYEGVPNVKLVQAAIGVQDGEVGFFKVKDGATSIDPFWAVQLASFNSAHLLKHGVSAEEIEEVKVPCLTLSSLLTQCGLANLDVLQVDTEGYDAEIVKMALSLPLVPECISFENAHLDSATRKEVFELLKQHGYTWTHDHWNTLALHERLTRRWSERANPSFAAALDPGSGGWTPGLNATPKR